MALSILSRFRVGALLGAACLVLSCGDDGGEPPPGAELLASRCNDRLDSVYEGREPPSDWSAEQRGDITRCAFERVVSIEEMQEAFTARETYVDPGVSTPASKFRIQYWTERGQGEPLLTSGALYIPETRRADPSPIVVIGHGSVGYADQCAPSLEDPNGFNQDNRAMTYTYAGDGWIVLVPDFPGLGTPGPPAYLYSVDEGHSVLDATRAARKLFNEGTLTDRNALLGLSQGSHAVLSALAFADEYGSEGTIDTIVPMSPIWISAGFAGALISTIGDALVTPTFMSITMQYFMGHLAAYEGEEALLDAFLPEKQQAALEMLEAGCWTQINSVEQGPPSIGVDVGSDLYLPAYVSEVGFCGLSNNCTTVLAETWRTRWVLDRPPPVTTIPVSHWTGGQDDFITPGWQKCGLDRLEGQGADITACVQPDAGHSDIVTRNAAWVRQHLDAVLLGGEPPAPCELLSSFDPGLTCTLPIPNSDNPNDP